MLCSRTVNSCVNVYIDAFIQSDLLQRNSLNGRLIISVLHLNSHFSCRFRWFCCSVWNERLPLPSCSFTRVSRRPERIGAAQWEDSPSVSASCVDYVDDSGRGSLCHSRRRGLRPYDQTAFLINITCCRDSAPFISTSDCCCNPKWFPSIPLSESPSEVRGQ